MNLKSIAPEKKLQRYGFIDALRGFAILGVLLVHTSQWVPPFSLFNQVVAENGAAGGAAFLHCQRTDHIYVDEIESWS